MKIRKFAKIWKMSLVIHLYRALLDLGLRDKPLDRAQ